MARGLPSADSPKVEAIPIIGGSGLSLLAYRWGVAGEAKQQAVGGLPSADSSKVEAIPIIGGPSG